MQAGSFSIYLLPEDFQPTLLGVALARSFLGASSSCSHLSLSDTCHCQSWGDKTHTTPSFGLIKSPGSFELINNCCIEILAGLGLRDAETLSLKDPAIILFIFTSLTPQLFILLK